MIVRHDENNVIEQGTYPQGVEMHNGVVLQICQCTHSMLPRMYRKDEPFALEHLCIHLTPYIAKVLRLCITASPATTLGCFADYSHTSAV